jgi:dolichol-phosphate mannosyltransferase
MSSSRPVTGRSKILIVLPTYNEASNLGRLVGDLRRECPEADLLVVDDNSPDGTGDVADQLAATMPGIHVFHRPGKLGLGSAHIMGLDRAVYGGYDIAVTMDCDYTHKPSDVPRLLAALEGEHADVAAGSRYNHADGVSDWPMWRVAISRTAHFCTKHVLGVPHDATSAFRAYRTEALRRVPYQLIRGNGYAFVFEMIFHCVQIGLKIAEVPMQMPIRQAGQSKISRMEIVRAVVTMARLASTRAETQVKLLTSNRPSPNA